jgi:ketosteroid isomerase-like protein
MMNNMKSPKAVAQDWLAAYNARDAHALIELYHDDMASAGCFQSNVGAET